MIKKNENYGISEDVTIAEFGMGDIIVAEGHIEGESVGVLLMANDEPNEIGTDHPPREGKTTDELKQDIIMIFKNIESLDVVIGALERVKEKMQESSLATLAALESRKEGGENG